MELQRGCNVTWYTNRQAGKHELHEHVISVWCVVCDMLQPISSIEFSERLDDRHFNVGDKCLSSQWRLGKFDFFLFKQYLKKGPDSKLMPMISLLLC